MKEELLSGPRMTPKKTYQSNGVKFFPLNRSVLEYRRPGVGNPVTRVNDAIAETSRGVCEEFHTWGSRPVGVGYDGTAVPRGEKTEPPRDVVVGFAVHGDVVMWKVVPGLRGQ